MEDSLNYITQLNAFAGHINVFHLKNVAGLYLCPSGYIGFNLIKDDYKYAKNFSQNQTKTWVYIVNLKDAKIMNPLNIFF